MPGSTGFWSGMLQGLEQGFNAVAGIDVHRQQLELEKKQLESKDMIEKAKFATQLTIAIPEFQAMMKTAQATGDTAQLQSMQKSLEGLINISNSMAQEFQTSTSGLPGGFKPSSSKPKNPNKPMTMVVGPGAAKPDSSPPVGTTAPSLPAGTPSGQAAAPGSLSVGWSKEFSDPIVANSGAQVTRDASGRATNLLFETPEQAEAFKAKLSAYEKNVNAPSGIVVADALTQGVSEMELKKLAQAKVGQRLAGEVEPGVQGPKGDIAVKLPQGVGIQTVPNPDGSQRLTLTTNAMDEDGNPTQGIIPLAMDPNLTALRNADKQIDPAKLGQLFGVLADYKASMPPEMQAQFEKMIGQDAEIVGRNALTILQKEGVIKPRKGGGYELNPFEISVGTGDYGPRRVDYIGAFEAMSQVLGSDVRGLAATSLQNAPVSLMATLDKVREQRKLEENMPVTSGGPPPAALSMLEAQSLMTQIVDLTRSYAHGDTGQVKSGTESTAVTNLLMLMADEINDVGLAPYLTEAKRTLRFLPMSDRKVAADRINQKLNMAGVYDGDLSSTLLQGD